MTGEPGASAESVWVIAGLGNPGVRYRSTRHNAGFLVVERLASRLGWGWGEMGRVRARVARGCMGSKALWLCQPQTFMNLSGEAVSALVRYRRVALAHVMVVVDDADLPLGTLRMRPGGSAGGHHGLESVESHLGTRDYARLKVGIGRMPQEEREITGYVLGRFGAEEESVLESVLDRAVDQLECWLQAGIREAMNRYNGSVLSSES